MKCPHCGVENAEGSQFCEQCGKAVAVAGGGPRLVRGEVEPTTGAARTLKSDDLVKTAKKAAGALLFVAVIQALVGTMLVINVKDANPQGNELTIAMATVYGIAVVFFGLYLWARRSPLPAAIAGLVVFITVHALDAVADPTSIGRGILMKVIVIAILARAIKAGIEYRRLNREPAIA